MPHRTAAALLLTAIALPALAHSGRRLEVQVVDDQLVGLGYISTGIDDGAGVERSYYNAIHDHFVNNTITGNTATADLPGFSVLDDADALIGHSLTWTATGFMKWSAPAASGPVNLSPLDSDELIEVMYGGVTVSSDTYNTDGTDSFVLLPSFNGLNGGDLDAFYTLTGDHPSGEIYVVQSVLSTTAPGVADSATMYTLLSPDGVNMVERLHHPSLYLESQLGTAVPEPASLTAFALLPLLMRRRRG